MARLNKLTKRKLEAVLTERLGLADPVFRVEKVGGRLVGDVISPTFRGQRDHERQGRIWDALDAELGAESVRLVGMLLAYTPEEWELGEGDLPASPKGKKAG